MKNSSKSKSSPLNMLFTLDDLSKDLGLQPQDTLNYLSVCLEIPYPGKYEEELSLAFSSFKEGKEAELSPSTLLCIKNKGTLACFEANRRLDPPYFGLTYSASTPASEAEALLDLLEIYPDDIDITPILKKAIETGERLEELHQAIQETRLFEQTSMQGFHDHFWLLPLHFPLEK